VSPRTFSSWNHWQAFPINPISRRIVGLVTPVMRTVLLMLLPSARAATTCTRWAVDSCFILSIMLARAGIVKAIVRLHFANVHILS
jgi:hypothetical protein